MTGKGGKKSNFSSNHVLTRKKTGLHMTWICPLQIQKAASVAVKTTFLRKHNIHSNSQSIPFWLIPIMTWLRKAMQFFPPSPTRDENKRYQKVLGKRLRVKMVLWGNTGCHKDTCNITYLYLSERTAPCCQTTSFASEPHNKAGAHLPSSVPETTVPGNLVSQPQWQSVRASVPFLYYIPLKTCGFTIPWTG